MSLAEQFYEPLLAHDRRVLSANPAIESLLAPAIAPRLLERFLLSFCARAVRMTEPAHRWMQAAGQRCIALGDAETGTSLLAHSKHETGQHAQLVEDTKALVAHWNARYASALSLGALFELPVFPATRTYITLHERTIASNEPWAQVATELEIERLSTAFGRRLLTQCKALLGANAASRLRFIDEYVALDVGHTRLNDRLLHQVLQRHPHSLDTMVRTGSLALRTYLRFIENCLTEAKAQTAITSPRRPPSKAPPPPSRP